MKTLHTIQPEDEIFIKLHSAAFYTRNQYYVIYKNNEYHIAYSKDSTSSQLFWSLSIWRDAINAWKQSGKPISNKVIR